MPSVVSNLQGFVLCVVVLAAFALAPFESLGAVAASASPYAGIPEGERARSTPVIVEGYHDGADCDKIFGWAWDSTAPNAAISVDIYDGSTKIATVLANEFRSDLTSKGNGFHAFNYTTPASLKNGQSHTITVKFANTQFNLTNTPKSLTCSLPDLTTSATVNSAYTAGQSVQVPVAVNRSGGPLPSSGVYVLARLYWSTNTTFGSGDIQLWESNGSTPDYPVSVLNSSGSKSVNATITIPNVSSGTYFILAYVDPTNFYSESNEGNNVSAYTVTVGPSCNSPSITAQPVDQTINSGQQAGLVVSATGTSPLSYQWYRGSAGDTSNPVSGATSASFTTPQLTSTTTYWARISNSCGSVNSRTVTVNVNPPAYEGYHDDANCDKIYGWAWDSSQPNAAISVDIYDGSTKIATVVANEFRQDLSNKGNGFHAFNYTTPNSLKNGQSHTITVRFANTSTNLTSTPRSLTCSLPDLTTSASVNSSYSAGQTVQVPVTVFRSGGPLPNTSTYALARLYWSTNSTYDSGDTQLWESNGSTPDFPVSTLNSTGNKTVNATITIPNVGAGTYYILAYVDPPTSSFPSGFYNESNENNNVTAYPVSIGVIAPAYEGYHDGADCDKIFGWAWDSNQPNTPISVDIYDGATKIATVVAGDFRPDLTSKGNGNHAFNYPTPDSLRNGVAHTITIKFVGTGTNLNSTPKSLTCIAPVIGVNPTSGPQVTTTFTTTGTGFTPNGQVRRLLTFPGQSTPQEISAITANGQGNISFTYTTGCGDVPGVYSMYLIDVTSNRRSNTVTETITSSASCSNAATITISPASGAQGTTFQITGNNFFPNGQVRRFTTFPNGVTYELPGTTANSSGQIAISIPTNCATAVGLYTTYMLDVASNRESTRASDQVTASSSCASPTSLQADPQSGVLGTTFRFTGTGFSPNSTASLSVTRPNGSSGGNAKYGTDSLGHVSFSVTSQPSDPSGSWTFVLTDDTTSRQASRTVEYAVAQSGTDVLTFITDVTYPDDSQVAPGSSFTKTWRLQNAGTSTWANYTATFVSSPRNGKPSVNLHASGATAVAVPTTGPGQTINFSIPMRAPSNPGTYYSYWELRNTGGVAFGVQFYVRIRVVLPQGIRLGYGTQSGRGGTNDSPEAKSARNADPVNTATGNYNYASTDLRVPGRGMDIELARSYNSQDPTVGPVGTGWSHTFNIFLANITSSSASVHYSDGKMLDFINQAGTNNFVSSYPGYYDVLIKNSDGTWTLRKTDQRTYNFDSSGNLVAIRDRNSNQISLSYSSGNLSTATDTVGRTFTFSYSGSLLTNITDPIGRNVQFSYDANSNLVSFRDANGNTNTYSYDANKRLIRIVDGRGNNLLVNAYGTNCPPGITSCVSTQTNGRGNLWTFTYNSDGSTSVFDPFGKETKYVQDVNFNIQLTQDRNAGSQFASGMANLHYDDNNNRDQLTDQKGNPTAYVYDQNGNVLSRTDPVLTLRQAVYDSNNNPTRITDELGKTTQVAYDAKGNLTIVTDPLNNSSSTTYNSFGQALTVTDSNGNVTTYTYDAQGNLTSVKDPLNNVTSYMYDGVGRRLSMTDARGKITRYTYDANDNLLTVTDPQGGVTTYTYDANNYRLSMRDPRGNTTTYAYDESNLLVKETDAKGFFVQHTHDKLDRRISTRDKRGNLTSLAYDNEGRLISVTDPLGNIMRYTYDANGNRTQVTDAKNQTTVFTYDAMNRVTKVQDALGNAIQKTYDAAGRLTKETDPQGNATGFSYDTVGNMTQVKDAAGGAAKYTYDKNQNRVSQTDPNNKTSNVAYDKLNRLLSSTNPLNHTSSYTYDEVGNRISQTDAKGQTTRYSYDGNSRLILITYPNNSTVQFTRDANGNVTRMVDSLGTTTYAYDELNRMTSVTDPFGKTIGYQYDENRNITRLTYPDGKAVTYQFDANNRMVSFTDWAAKTTILQYDSTNLLTQVAYPNGIVTSFTYDSAGRLIAKSDSGISSYTFTLDKNGNRTSASITQPLGNRLYTNSQNYTYNAANRIQSAGSTTFAFDNNGNMTSKTEAGVLTSYGYDFENRLISVGIVSQYFYNGEGVRLQKVEGNKTTRYVVDTNHDLSQVLCETDAIGVIAAYYVYGAGLAYKVDPNGRHYYYSFDPLGSTIALTDDAKNVVNSYAYDPFGLAVGSVENTTNPFTFVGEYGVSKDANGMLFMRARYYSALTGTFINVDPAERDIYRTQDLNPFSYAANNPVNEIDPAGLFSIRQKARQFGDAVKNKVNSVVDAFKDPFNPNTGVFRYGGPLYNATGWSQSGLCGPGNNWFVLLEKVVPDRPFGFDATGPCANHDAAYGRIRSSLLSDEEKYQLRLQADQAVRAEIKSTCLRQGGNYDVCTILGELYFAGVRIGGPLAAYGFDWNATMLDYARMIRPKAPCPF